MFPIIAEILGAMLESGAAEGAAAEGAAVEGGGALMKKEGASILNNTAEHNIPEVLQRMSGIKDSRFHVLPKQIERPSDHDSTMERISDIFTGDSEKPAVSSNDNEHAFGGNDHLITDGRNSHILKMFKGDGGREAANDNGRDDAMLIISSLAPLIESIDRNTSNTLKQAEAIREIISKIEEKTINESSFNKEQAEIDDNSISSSNSNGIPDLSNESENESSFNKNDEKKNGFFKNLMGLVGNGLLGGALAGTGDMISPDYTPPHTDAGGYDGPVNEPVTGKYTPREKAFLDIISKHEDANYDTVFGKGQFGKPSKKLTDMTINEVLAFQDELRKSTKKAGYGKINGKVVGTSAVGKGQFVEGTLKQNLLKLHIPKSQWDKVKFTPELQDKLILSNARANGIDPNRPQTLANQTKVGNQWESLAPYKLSAKKYSALVAGLNNIPASARPADGQRDMASITGHNNIAGPSNPSLALPELAKSPTSGKGSLVNNNSANHVVNNNNITVITAPTTNVNKQMASNDKKNTLPPSARPDSWTDWSKYFGY